MQTSTKNRIKLIGFILLLMLAVFGVFFHLYNRNYTSAMLQLFLILPAIINRKKLLDKCGLA